MVDQVRTVESDKAMVIVGLRSYTGINQETAKVSYKALQKGDYHLAYPRANRMELVVPLSQTPNLRVGDRVKVTGYQVFGHSIYRGARIAPDARVTRVGK